MASGIINLSDAKATTIPNNELVPSFAAIPEIITKEPVTATSRPVLPHRPLSEASISRLLSFFRAPTMIYIAPARATNDNEPLLNAGANLAITTPNAVIAVANPARTFAYRTISPSVLLSTYKAPDKTATAPDNVINVVVSFSISPLPNIFCIAVIEPNITSMPPEIPAIAIPACLSLSAGT